MGAASLRASLWSMVGSRVTEMISGWKRIPTLWDMGVSEVRDGVRGGAGDASMVLLSELEVGLGMDDVWDGVRGGPGDV